MRHDFNKGANMNNNSKSLKRIIDSQQEVVQHLTQKVLTLSQSLSKAKITQDLLLMLLMKYDPNLLKYIENEMHVMEEYNGRTQIHPGTSTQYKKVICDMRKIAQQSKKASHAGGSTENL